MNQQLDIGNKISSVGKFTINTVIPVVNDKKPKYKIIDKCTGEGCIVIKKK